MAANPDKPALVYKQIEDTADYYEPSIYSILQMFTTLELKGETQIENIFPMTSVRPFTDVAKNSRLFAIGVLPPPNKVTQRPLDRSATLSNVGVLEVQPVDTLPAAAAAAGAAGGISLNQAWDANIPVMTLPGYQLRVSTADAGKLGDPKIPQKSPCSGGALIHDDNDPNGPLNKSTGKRGRVTRSECINQLSTKQAWSAFYEAYKQVYQKEPSATMLHIIVAHSKRETGFQWPNNNPGQIGAQGGDNGVNWGFRFANNNTVWWKSYDDPVAGCKAYIQLVGPVALQQAEQGDMMGYLTSLARKNYFGEPLDLYYNNYWPDKNRHGVAGGGFPTLLKEVAQAMGPDADLDDGSNLKKGVPKSCAFTEGTKGGDGAIPAGGFYPERIKKTFPAYAKEHASQAISKGGEGLYWRFTDPDLYGPGSNCEFKDEPPVPTDPDAPGAIQLPTSDPKKKKTAEELLDEQTAVRNQWTDRFKAAQNQDNASLASSIEAMKNIPPLKLLINPTSFKVSKEKIVNDGTWTRTGNVIHHWGDNQDKIEGSGKIAAFYALDQNNPWGPGINRSARNWSKGYQNFLSLYLLYRNNAAIYTKDPGAKDRSFIALVGSIYIYYDGTLYIGSFDSLNVTEDASSPYTLEYSFSFTVRAWYTLDRPDPQERNTYGNPNFSGVPELPTKTDFKVLAASEAQGLERKLKNDEYLKIQQDLKAIKEG